MVEAKELQSEIFYIPVLSNFNTQMIPVQYVRQAKTNNVQNFIIYLLIIGLFVLLLHHIFIDSDIDHASSLPLNPAPTYLENTRSGSKIKISWFI